MEKIFDFIFSKKMYLPLIYIFIAVIIYIILCTVVNKVTNISSNKANLKKQQTVASLLKSIIKYLIIIITLILILNVYEINTTSIIASLSVIGVVVGLAFQDMIKNLIASVTIIFDGHYSVGDNVEINGFRGEVISLGLQTTKLKAKTGEIFIVTNNSITKVINYSLKNSKIYFEITLDKKTDIKKFEKTMIKIKQNIEKLDGVKEKIDLMGIDTISDNSLIYKISIKCLSDLSGNIRRNIISTLKTEFELEKVDFIAIK